MRIKGSPTRSAVVVTIQTTFPTILPPVLRTLVVEATLEEMLSLVSGGTISTSAVKRSNKDSDLGESEEIEEREREDDDAWDDDGEP